MSNSVIQVSGLSKRYIIGHQRERGDDLRHALENAVRAPLRWFGAGRKRSGATREEFWALRDVDFEVGQGEVVGVIGSNGAGKSTLLKILSRITEPTEGRIRLRGRVASLLEVGTGFHPELSGRENIYLNGAILGMTRREIRTKFDEIVAFSDIERFLDTPVKRYSSGMYVRLAFAVAAHLEPEILIVDEVLAVGDAAFQKKCLGKMDEVAHQGRTVLFVSHNMPMVVHLCRRGVMLKGGRVFADGPVRTVVDRYLADVAGNAAEDLGARNDRSGDREVIATRVELLDADGAPAPQFVTGQRSVIRVHYRCRDSSASFECRAGIIVRRSEQLCMVLSSWMVSKESLIFSGEGAVDFVIPEMPLGEGCYALGTFFESSALHDAVEHAAEMSVADGDFFGTGRIRPSAHWQHAGVLVPHECRIVPAAEFASR